MISDMFEEVATSDLFFSDHPWNLVSSFPWIRWTQSYSQRRPGQELRGNRETCPRFWT